MKDGRVGRVTFSKSLADHVAGLAGGAVSRYPLVIGRPLARHEKSSSGLYALISKRKGSVLRVALSEEEADLLCDYASRGIHECWFGAPKRP